MKMAVESMEMAPGAIPRPGRVPEQRLLSPETRLRWRRCCGTFRGSRLPSLRVFMSGAIYRWKGDVGGRLEVHGRELQGGGGAVLWSDTSPTYLKFLMLHACFYTICVMFRYTSWHFYAFSRTNLLTSRHSASSLFSAIFVFQKSYTGNILGIG
jgi:hypothetical protein